ncbi:MAG: hypothetical protein A2498_13545 [Lentisphaerae bacterium RIFOXYC12_FULL_60_16]|nr:MAG: hypothetical protein A2498_13545 [Lentisphaerae bacterium RIFOXYC12_FULL_60_16]OGV71543.1 MAG: hypothetical protein A2269_04640 [Lentisphaerae bacterium RIFOXYA12_FULL_60_10]OGV83792.1 MAG: hypothetical protein A2340_05490 [Lentisphaerae bacterium RIFOXYB12_FULL_60_10]
MPTLGQLMSDAIRKLARKESRIMTTDLRRQQIAYKRASIALRRQVQALERQVRLLARTEQKHNRMMPAIADAPGDARVRITSRTIIAMRRKLHLTQDAFAKLVETSPQAVYLWERKHGPLRLRTRTLNMILAARKLGAREAQQILESKGVKRGRRRTKRR